VDISSSYSSLFWFGLGATICYVLMILILRKSYGKLGRDEHVTSKDLP